MNKYLKISKVFHLLIFTILFCPFFRACDSFGEKKIAENESVDSIQKSEILDSKRINQVEIQKDTVNIDVAKDKIKKVNVYGFEMLIKNEPCIDCIYFVDFSFNY